MSSNVSASPRTAQTAITRMSSSRCSTFHAQRGSSMVSNAVIRASSMASPSVGKGRALAGQPARIEAPDFMRSPWPGTATLEELVATAKLRWRVERDFAELKQEIGLGHFEGRGWRGFHHHASLCIAAYAFLAAERCRFPPGWRPELEAPERPADYRPRGSSRAPGAAQPGLDRDLAPAPRGGAAAPPAALPLLPAELRAATRVQQFMTR